jgi:hypothetical protein
MLAPDGQAACIFKVIGAPRAMFGIATVAAAAAPVAAAALKNLRLEGVLTPFMFLFFDICPPIINKLQIFKHKRTEESSYILELF